MSRASLNERDRDEILTALQNSASIPAISVQQPYAHHILFDGKDVENRGWVPGRKHLGWMLLHAGIKPYDGGARERREMEQRGMQFGGIVGAICVTDFVRDHPSPWFSGPWGWVIGEKLALEFIPLRGAQGLFYPAIDPIKLKLLAV